MSGRELDPDGTDSFHPEHPWEQVTHPLWIAPDRRTSLNWPPEPAYPAGPHEAKLWDRLPVRVTPTPEWRRLYGYAHPKGRTPILCKLGIHRSDYSGSPHTHAPRAIHCRRCGKTL